MEMMKQSRMFRIHTEVTHPRDDTLCHPGRYTWTFHFIFKCIYIIQLYLILLPLKFKLYLAPFYFIQFIYTFLRLFCVCIVCPHVQMQLMQWHLYSGQCGWTVNMTKNNGTSALRMCPCKKNKQKKLVLDKCNIHHDYSSNETNMNIIKI